MPLCPLVHRLAEGTAQSARRWLVPALPPGLSSHSNGERRRLTHAESLDDAVGRARFDVETAAQGLHTLRMQRVHDDVIGPGDLPQHAARGELDLVRRPVLNVEHRLVIFAMVAETI